MPGDRTGDELMAAALAAKEQSQEKEVCLRSFLTPATDLLNRELRERNWIWNQWLPRGEPSMTGGPPGAGKSLLAQQIATGASCQSHVFNEECTTTNVLYLTCEDDLDELHRRQVAINDHYGIGMESLTNLNLVSFRGEDARLAHKVGEQFLPSPRYRELSEMIGDLELGLVFLDLIPDFYDGNENSRNEVNRFVKGTLGSLANRHNCAINFLHHPSRSGIADGSGQSGSTAWEGSVRSRLYLTGEDQNGVRTLSRKKSNYSGKNDGFNLVWRDGALYETDSQRAEKRVKPMGKYAQAALDALTDSYKGVPIPLETWRENFLETYTARNGEKPDSPREAWRGARAQLSARGAIDEAEGRAWPVN